MRVSLHYISLCVSVRQGTLTSLEEPLQGMQEL